MNVTSRQPPDRLVPDHPAITRRERSIAAGHAARLAGGDVARLAALGDQPMPTALPHPPAADREARPAERPLRGALTRFLRALVDATGRVIAHRRRAGLEEDAIRALSSLSDHALSDIGIRRESIPHVARRMADRACGLATCSRCEVVDLPTRTPIGPNVLEDQVRRHAA